jgi:hypothetical protein
MNSLIRLVTLCVATLTAVPVVADDLRWSGFGTVGYARSGNEFRYQRFIDSDGTLTRDSLFGVQADAVLTPEVSATVQVRLAPAGNSDEEWNVRLPWAFLSWRPSNELTVRGGKLRIPMLLYSENIDVGTTFPFARLPIEIYSILPTWDFYGLSVGRNWMPGNLDVDLDGFAGWAHGTWRVHLRDAPPQLGVQPGSWYEGISGAFVGAILTVREAESRYRFAALAWDAQLDTLQFGVDYPYVQVAPGVGYYQVDNRLPGPGVQMKDRIRFYTLSAGLEQELQAGFRLVGELAWRRSERIGLASGTNSLGSYLALLKPIGSWTPYIYGAALRSSDHARTLYSSLDRSRLPAAVPGAAVVNASQTGAADSALVFDQRTVALGATYAVGRGQVVKAEWQRTRIGLVSAFYDAPLGVSSGGQKIDVFSLSYNFAF